MQAGVSLNVGRVELGRPEVDAFVRPVGQGPDSDVERGPDRISEAMYLTLSIQRLQVECFCGLGVLKMVGYIWSDD